MIENIDIIERTLLEVEFINIENESTIDFWKKVLIYPKIGEHYEDDSLVKYVVKDIIWVYNNYVKVILKKD